MKMKTTTRMKHFEGRLILCLCHHENLEMRGASASNRELANASASFTAAAGPARFMLEMPLR
jgi:hypothetical protein